METHKKLDYLLYAVVFFNLVNLVAQISWYVPQFLDGPWTKGDLTGEIIIKVASYSGAAAIFSNLVMIVILVYYSYILKNYLMALILFLLVAIQLFISIPLLPFIGVIMVYLAKLRPAIKGEENKGNKPSNKESSKK